MASTFNKTQPIIRDHVIAGRSFRMVIDGTGITFFRKGDKRKEKPSVMVPWLNIVIADPNEDANYLATEIDSILGFKTNDSNTSEGE